MASFRLSAHAEADLVAIYDYTHETFGQYQADAYLSGLDRSFGLLADFPGIGQTVDELRVGYRRFRFQSHFIFYTEGADGVVIRAILHVARDLRPSLFS